MAVRYKLIANVALRTITVPSRCRIPATLADVSKSFIRALYRMEINPKVKGQMYHYTPRHILYLYLLCFFVYVKLSGLISWMCLCVCISAFVCLLSANVTHFDLIIAGGDQGVAIDPLFIS